MPTTLLCVSEIKWWWWWWRRYTKSRIYTFRVSV